MVVNPLSPSTGGERRGLSKVEPWATVVPPGPRGRQSGMCRIISWWCGIRPPPGPLGSFFGFDELGDGLDEGQVGEGLRVVPEVLAAGGVDLLGVEVERAGEGQQLLAQVAGPGRTRRSWPGR